ncbi:MAG: hypothetical protein N3B01_02675 [Verrucomicrobiae bacterium]|nr:hypothetical protein [Verrucomicrobiae bacterium]
MSVLMVVALVCARALAGASVVGIAFKPDPPPALDGQLRDWEHVPCALLLNRREQATWGATPWKSTNDLSAKVWLAWRPESFYVAADVTDERLRSGLPLFLLRMGDCVQLLLDVAPDDEPGRSGFGKGQFQIVLSPGRFRPNGEPQPRYPPRLYCVHPRRFQPAGAVVAAQKTAHGYSLEASIPWVSLGVRPPAIGTPLRFDIAVVDADGWLARPEKLLSVSEKPWEISRKRLIPAVLAGADGCPPAVAEVLTVFELLKLQPRAKQSFRFGAPRPPQGKDAVLVLKARLDAPRVGGYAQALRLTLNGGTLDGGRLVNKPLEAKRKDGRTVRFVAADRFTTYYAPDFTAADSSGYGVAGVKSSEFELRVTDLLREGENELLVENACGENVTRSLVAADCKLVFAAPPMPPKPRAGPPTGPLPVCLPAKLHGTGYRVRELADAKLEIEVAGETFAVESRFSTPVGRWERGSNAFFVHSRRIEHLPEAIVVFDTFNNLTDENLPLMQRHEAQLPGLSKVWLAGLPAPALSGTAAEPANPTTFGATERAGLGLLPLNDEFQVHVRNYAGTGLIGLADEQFVLQPRKSYTAEWAIVPVARPDYFDFVNAARRLRDVNFTIPYCFAFLRAGKLTEQWTDQQFTDFIRLKSANLVCAGLATVRYKGRYPHGLAFQQVPHDSYKRWVERVRRLAPEAKTCIYFHCFINAEENAAQKFPDARVLRADGSHADYGQPFYGLFFPTETNAYGRAVRRNVDIVLNEIKADGVYWDELEYSAYAYHYGEPWDGCSADIDPQTMKIRRLKSSITLLSQPWRVALIREIMARGPLIANGQPHTRTIARLKFPRFVETASIDNCARAQLYTPIALGDHLSERSEEDAYRNMVRALDYGCVSHWYGDLQVIPRYETLTKYMYPITPLELREGYIIGRERILTNRSGLFGWGDRSRHEVHVFDDTGREVPDFKAPTVERDGATFTELRIPEGWSAAILRR